MQSSAFDEAVVHSSRKITRRRSATSTDLNSSMRSILDYDEDLEGQYVESLKYFDVMIDTETVVFDDALVSERHGEIKVIMNDSTKQLNTISKDLAEIADSQDDDIKRMSWFAIDAFENTESGLEQVVRAAKFTEQYQHSQRRKTVLFTLLGVIVVLAFSHAFLMNGGDGSGPVQSQYTGDMDSHDSPSPRYSPIINVRLP